jgi:hypothetical protein
VHEHDGEIWGGCSRERERERERAIPHGLRVLPFLVQAVVVVPLLLRPATAVVSRRIQS